MRVLERYLRRVKRMLLHRGSSREDAEDLVQEAMLRLLVYTQQGGKVRDSEAFMTRTALNLAIDVHRHSRADLYEPETIEEMEHLVGLEPSPDEVLAAEQRLLKYKDALDRVSERTREIFFMHRLQGFSHAEIAKKIGISTSAIEKHVASAVTTLALERQRE